MYIICQILSHINLFDESNIPYIWYNSYIAHIYSMQPSYKVEHLYKSHFATTL
ncbi:hypothetical protein VIOR103205_12250 [Vibrio ordalii]